jgi:HTH-type transcriptional regulator, sugar sensing transcriptional regulator
MIGNIPKTKEELKEQVDAVAKQLEILGLIAHGFGPAETIANTAHIPRTSAYKVLDSLCAKRFATSTGGRPKIYRPEPPLKIQERIQDEISELFRTLQMLSEIVTETGLPQLVFTISGKDKVIHKISQIIDESTRSVIISSPVFSQISDELQKPIQTAISRGVAITVITLPSQRTQEKVKVYRKTDLLSTDVVVDDKISLITSMDLTACGYTDNEFITQHFLGFLKAIMNEK